MAHPTTGAPAPNTLEASTAEVRHLRIAISDIARTAHVNLSEIAAIARLTLAAMETPLPYRFPDLIAQALRSIWAKAGDAEEIIGCEAEEVGCEVIDDATRRRDEAHDTAKAQQAAPDLHRAASAAEALLTRQKWKPSEHTPEGAVLMSLRSALAKVEGRAAA